MAMTANGASQSTMFRPVRSLAMDLSGSRALRSFYGFPPLDWGFFDAFIPWSTDKTATVRSANTRSWNTRRVISVDTP